MNDIDKLKHVLNLFSGLTEDDFMLSENFWHEKSYGKGEFYNNYHSVCKHLGFIVEGTFRSYVIDQKTGEEKNIFFYSINGFVVTFKSFVNQIPCEYHTQAMTDAKVICIGIQDLTSLYKMSHNWENLGRLLAQTAFNVVVDRVESFIIQSPEERYLNLIKLHPEICNTIPLYHISSYLGIQGPSLSRIRKRIIDK
ncbi:MAG: CRP-like cAMP-binding protein [Crocinitomix sp.]|jgi:CRP-like cAMP-binding protein